MFPRCGICLQKLRQGSTSLGEAVCYRTRWWVFNFYNGANVYCFL